MLSVCWSSFIQELIKNTDRSHGERKSLERALEEMLVCSVVYCLVYVL